jgi:K+-sensing histidine kinase KdpD
MSQLSRRLGWYGDARISASASMSSNAEPDFGAPSRSFFRTWMTPVAASLTLIAATTLVLWPLQVRLNHQHLIFIYLVPTSWIAIRYGSISAMCVIIASSLAAAYFLYPPRFSFIVEDPLGLLELALFCVLALLASRVVSGFAADDDVAARRQRGASLLRRWPAMAALWDRLR